MPIWHFKASHSSLVSWNMKSSGKRPILRFTCLFSILYHQYVFFDIFLFCHTSRSLLTKITPYLRFYCLEVTRDSQLRIRHLLHHLSLQFFAVGMLASLHATRQPVVPRGAHSVSRIARVQGSSTGEATARPLVACKARKSMTKFKV